MQRKSLLIRNINFPKNIVIIYLSIFLLIFSIFNTSLITEMVSADSNIYYVSTIGSDFWNGLYPTYQGGVNGPFRTIQKAVNVSTNGDTIYILGGFYSSLYMGQIRIWNKNSANSWLTIRNYNDDDVIIDGTDCPIMYANSSSYWSSVIDIRDSKYIHISGLMINHSKRGGISVYDYGTDCSFIHVDNCSITNCSTWAIKVASGNNITFEHNNLFNNFNNWGSWECTQETVSFETVSTFSINNNIFLNNRQINIDIKGGGRWGEICYNEINNSAGHVFIAGYDLYGGAGVYIDARGLVHNISIYNNNIYGNNTGICLNTETSGHFEYIFIYNNIINITNPGNKPDPPSGRVPFLLSNSGLSTDLFHHIYIYNNLIRSGIYNVYNVFQVGHYSIQQFNPSTLQDVFVFNNIFFTASTSSVNMMSINHISYEDGVFIISNNSYYRTTGTLRVYWDGITYTTSNPEKWGYNPMFTDPKFVDNQNQGGDFHLQSDSPCIDTANNILIPSVDYDGISRPQGTKSDRGTYEYISFYDTTPPQISNISILTSNPLDTDSNFGWENISCTVTDNIGVDVVYIKIIRPNGAEINIEMTKITSSNYYYYNSTLSDYGNYSYSIRAIDTSDNTKYSNSFYFSLAPNWDINSDGRCSILDLILLSNRYNEVGYPGWIREDVDNNGIVNILDMSLVSDHYDENWYT